MVLEGISCQKMSVFICIFTSQAACFDIFSFMSSNLVLIDGRRWLLCYQYTGSFMLPPDGLLQT
jgi:hypothetical protein